MDPVIILDKSDGTAVPMLQKYNIDNQPRQESDNAVQFNDNGRGEDNSIGFSVGDDEGLSERNAGREAIVDDNKMQKRPPMYRTHIGSSVRSNRNGRSAFYDPRPRPESEPIRISSSFPQGTPAVRINDTIIIRRHNESKIMDATSYNSKDFFTLTTKLMLNDKVEDTALFSIFQKGFQTDPNKRISSAVLRNRYKRSSGIFPKQDKADRTATWNSTYRNTVRIGPFSRADLKSVLRCEASNSNLTAPVAASFIIDMNCE